MSVTPEQITRLKGLIAECNLADFYAGTPSGQTENFLRRFREIAPSLLAAIPVWQPIPTRVDTSKAPFDGKRYLMIFSDGFQAILMWNACGWCAQPGDGGSFPRIVLTDTDLPTNYQTLPTPPTGEGE